MKVIYNKDTPATVSKRKILPVLSGSDPFFYFVFDSSISNQDVYGYRNTTDRKAIVDSAINDLIVVDMSHSIATSISDLAKELDEALRQIFIDRLGHTTTADEEDFPDLFITRIQHDNRGYNLDLKENPCPYSAVRFRLRPELCINNYSFSRDETIAEIAGYVERHGRLDLKAHTDELRERQARALNYEKKQTSKHGYPYYGSKYEYTNLRNNITRHVRLFNTHKIFVRSATLELIYDPKKAARQELSRSKREAARKLKKETVSPTKITHGEIRIFYWGLRNMAELALLGEDFSESNLSRSIFQTARRSMAFIDLIDAVFTGKPYRYLNSFINIRELFKTIPKEKHSDYPRRFVEFFTDEIARHPKPPKKKITRWDIRRESFIYPYYRKKFKYVRDMKFPIAKYDPNA